MLSRDRIGLLLAMLLGLAALVVLLVRQGHEFRSPLYDLYRSGVEEVFVGGS